MKTVIVRSAETDKKKIEIPTSYNDLTDLPVIPPEYVPPTLIAIVYHSRTAEGVESPSTYRVDFDQEEYSSGGGVVTTGGSWSYTVPASQGGLYLISGFITVEFDPSTKDVELLWECVVGGTVRAASTLGVARDSTANLTVALTLTTLLNAGDTVYFQLTNNNPDGLNVTTDNDPATNGISITRLR